MLSSARLPCRRDAERPVEQAFPGDARDERKHAEQSPRALGSEATEHQQGGADEDPYRTVDRAEVSRVVEIHVGQAVRLALPSSCSFVTDCFSGPGGRAAMR